MPSEEQLRKAEETTNRFREKIGNKMKLYFIVPDYYADRPKACMNGWGSVFLNVAPDGLALPCHEARMLPGLDFPNVRDHDMEWIWNESPAFNAYRGESWMKEPCRSCDERTTDFGGCRCQAFQLTGDAANTDPVCDKSEHHHIVTEQIELAQKPQPPAADIKPIIFYRDDKNSKALIAENT
jgi:pyrroloquinoline quinone biosynthesis protein E